MMRKKERRNRDYNSFVPITCANALETFIYIFCDIPQLAFFAVSFLTPALAYSYIIF